MRHARRLWTGLLLFLPAWALLCAATADASCATSAPTITIRAGSGPPSPPMEYVMDVWATGRWGSADVPLGPGVDCPEGLTQCTSQDWREDLGLNAVRIGLWPAQIDLAAEWPGSPYPFTSYSGWRNMDWSCNGTNIAKMHNLFRRHVYRPGIDNTDAVNSFGVIRAAVAAGYRVVLPLFPGYVSPPGWYPVASDFQDPNDFLPREQNFRSWVFAIGKYLQCKFPGVVFTIEAYNEPVGGGFGAYAFPSNQPGWYKEMFDHVQGGLEQAGATSYDIVVGSRILPNSVNNVELWLDHLLDDNFPPENWRWDGFSVHPKGGQASDCELVDFANRAVAKPAFLPDHYLFQTEWLDSFPGSPANQDSGSKSVNLASSILTSANAGYRGFGIYELFESLGENCSGDHCFGLIEVGEDPYYEYENDFDVQREFYYGRMALRGTTGNPAAEALFPVTVMPSYCNPALGPVTATVKRSLASPPLGCNYASATVTAVNRATSEQSVLIDLGETVGSVTARWVRPPGHPRQEEPAVPGQCLVAADGTFSYTLPPQSIVQFKWECSPVQCRSCYDPLMANCTGTTCSDSLPCPGAGQVCSATCPIPCPPCAVCGDRICELDETPCNCPKDCGFQGNGECPRGCLRRPEKCGDMVCDRCVGESRLNCPIDCPTDFCSE